jgi:hypothetical protein
MKVYFLKHPSHFWAYMLLEPNREIRGFFKEKKKIQKLEIIIIIIIIINLAILKEIQQLAKISQKKTSPIGP